MKVYQANSTLFIRFDKSDDLGVVDLRSILNQLMTRLKAPFVNVIVDFGSIHEIDPHGMKVLLLGKRLSEIGRAQVSIFNAQSRVLQQMKEQQVFSQFFFCDQSGIAC